MKKSLKTLLFKISIIGLGTATIVSTTCAALYFILAPSSKKTTPSYAQSIANKIKNEYSTRHTNLFLGNSSFEINKSSTVEEFGIDFIDSEESMISFNVSSIDRYNGILNVVATIDYQGTEISKSFKVIDFQNEITYYTNKADLQFDKITSVEHWVSGAKEITSIVINSPKSQWSDIGLSKPDDFDDDLLIEFNPLKHTYEDLSIKYGVKLHQTLSNKTIFEKMIEIDVFGYSTDDVELNDIASVLRNIDSSLKTSKDDTLPSVFAIGSTQTRESLGIVALQIPSSMTSKMEISAINDLAGEVHVNLTLTQNNKSLSKKIVITGFSSNDMIDVNDILSKINDIESTTSKVLPSSIVDCTCGIFTLEDSGVIFGFELNGTEIQFETIPSNINDDNGTIIADVIVSKGSAVKRKEIMIRDFMTANDVKLLDLLSKFKDTYTTFKIDDLPSSIPSSNLTAAIIGISQPEANGAIIEYSKLSSDDINGILKVKVTVYYQSSSTKKLTKELTVNGFWTQQKEIDAINSTLQVFTNKTTTLTTVNASSVGNVNDIVSQTKLGVTFTLPSNNVTTSLKVKSINDLTGEVVVTVTATLNNSTQTKDITVSGFNTSSTTTPILIYSDENSLTINNNLSISKYYFEDDSIYVSIPGGGSSFGDNHAAYVIELTNGVKFQFGMPSNGNFFAGYNFNRSNEDPQIKAILTEFVNDTISYLNFGISQGIGMNITIYGTAIKGDMVAATNNPGHSGLRQVYLNYNYKTLQKYSDKMTSTTFDPYFREYNNAISLLVHEVGHYEAEYALSLFNDDLNSWFEYEDDDVDYIADEDQLHLNKGYDGVDVGGKLIKAFEKIGVNMSDVLSNMSQDLDGFFRSSNNYNKSGSTPTRAQFNVMMDYLYEEDFIQAVGDVYDNTPLIQTNFDFSGKSVNFGGFDGNNDGQPDSSITYSNSKDWFVNNALNQFLKRNVAFEANSDYMFNLHEFLTRVMMLITQQGIRKGATWFGESISSTMGNMLNARVNSINSTNAPSTNAQSFISYQSGIGFNNNNYGLDVMTKEYFNFGGRIGYDNVIKILQNRETILTEFLSVLYGGFNRSSIYGNQPVVQSDPHGWVNKLTWENLWLFGTSTTRDVSVKWKRRKDTTWKTYKLPQSHYKPIVYRVGGADRVVSNLYYYDSYVPINIEINNQNHFVSYADYSTDVSEMDILIQLVNSKPVKDVALWSNQYKVDGKPHKIYTRTPIQYSPMLINNLRSISFTPLLFDTNSTDQFIVKYF